ncbi:hypothetical protein NEAUS03_1672 [Nematocida ausubeli]|nr:hypothetical protein NEAUS03_1672 [Nematocida ausubeli]
MTTTPLWLLNSAPKQIVLKSVLKDINGLVHYEDILSIIKTATFTTRLNYLTKVSIVVFLFLRSKSIPILIEDVLIYCNSNKMTFLSLLVKNKGIVPDSVVSESYVVNVLNRIYSSFRKHITLSYDYVKERVITLFSNKYYHNKSPLISVLILLFYDDKKKLVSIVKEHYVNITMYSVNKEITRISQIIKEKIAEKNCLASETINFDKMIQKPKEQDADRCESQENIDINMAISRYNTIKQQEKEAKVDRAIQLYKEGLGTSNKYATDYEGLMIEGMVRKGYSKEMIMSLTYKGLEYYSSYK